MQETHNMDTITLTAIGHVQSAFRTKFGLPRQSGLVDELKARIVLVEAYRRAEMARGLEEFSHIWVLWGFHGTPEGEWSATVRPPKLGGNARVGVFASRAPFRPNPVGLSCVRLEHIERTRREGPVLHVAGADMLDGSPVYDIKPYVPADVHPDARTSFAGRPDVFLSVADPSGALADLPEDVANAVRSLLTRDPRPSYHRDEGRIYVMEYGTYIIRFCVRDGAAFVESICTAPELERP